MVSDIVGRFAQMPIPVVSDALDRIGVNGGLLGIKALSPGSRCVGPAYTLRFEAVAAGVAAPAADYVDEVPRGAVIVLDNGGRLDCTVWGDILTLIAGQRGIAGTVIHAAAGTRVESGSSRTRCSLPVCT